MFAGGVRHPGGPFEPVDPTEVLAGAALIALSLPGGERVRRIPQMDFAEAIAAAAVPPPDTELIQLALHALREVATEGHYAASWVSDADREQSRRTIRIIDGVLASHLAATPD